MSECIRGSYNDVLYKSTYTLQGARNKVLNCQDITLLDRRVLPLVSYVAPWSVTDDDKTTDARRAKQYCMPSYTVTLCRQASNNLVRELEHTGCAATYLFTELVVNSN